MAHKIVVIERVSCVSFRTGERVEKPENLMEAEPESDEDEWLTGPLEDLLALKEDRMKSKTQQCQGNQNSSLVERCVVELDIVAPDAPEAGQDLGEGRDDEVLAVPARREFMASDMLSIRPISRAHTKMTSIIKGED